MSLARKTYLDFDWPSWVTSRFPFERPESWLDMVGDSGIRVEEFEEGKDYVVRAEVPGIDPDKDVELTLVDGSLRIMVHRQKESKNGDARHFRSEFHYGSFTRYIPLPASATDKDVKADFHGGILEVRVPLNGEQAKERRIAIAKH